MNHRTRYVVMSVTVLAAIVGMVSAHAAAWAMGQLALGDAALGGGAGPRPSQLIGVLVALGSALGVLRAPTTRTLAHEVVDELARASWPTRQETWRATVVVLCTVAICALYLGVLDAAWLSLTDTLLTPSAGMLADGAQS